MVSAEQKEYAEVFDYSRGLLKTADVITDYSDEQSFGIDLTTRIILIRLISKSKANKGKGGIDGMQRG